MPPPSYWSDVFSVIDAVGYSDGITQLVPVYSPTTFWPTNIRVSAGDGETIQPGIRNAVHDHDVISRTAPIGRAPVDNGFIALPNPFEKPRSR